MPRILPRLLTAIERSTEPSSWTPFVLPRRGRESLHKPVPPRPSFHPAHHTKSILLDQHETNPITSSRVYLRHKSLLPSPHPSRRVKHRKDSHDRPRAMTEQERQWWSSPYLRMLASPIRQCMATERYLPSDFLIRLAPMRLPPSLYPPGWKRATAPQTLIPDGLQHSKYTVRKSDKANYVLCNRASISILAEYQAKRLASKDVSIHLSLAFQIAHLLRLRVLQELELLADQMQSHLDRGTQPKSKSRLIRRLSRDEWAAFHTEGTIPYPNAIAVLVVPQLQKDPITKRRPEPSMSAAPPKPEDTAATPKTALPLSTLHPVAPAEWDPALGNGILPEEQIPLYNGVALFPARSQRAALHALLTRLLGIERLSRHSPEEGGGPASHAFLLCSDGESVLRGDVAAVAIALWRVRMFEDAGEDVASQKTAGWELPHR